MATRDDLGGKAWKSVRRLHLMHQAGAQLAASAEPDGIHVSVDLTRAVLPELAEELARVLDATL